MLNGVVGHIRGTFCGGTLIKPNVCFSINSEWTRFWIILFQVFLYLGCSNCWSLCERCKWIPSQNLSAHDLGRTHFVPPLRSARQIRKTLLSATRRSPHNWTSVSTTSREFFHVDFRDSGILGHKLTFCNSKNRPNISIFFIWFN